MATKLEKYLQQNREMLDVENPDDDFLWAGIDKGIEKKKQPFQMNWKVASIVLLALMSGFILNSVLNQKPQVVQFSLADVSPELGKKEQFFQVAIQQKMDVIGGYEIDSSKYADFFSEMKILDEFHQQNIADYKQIGNNPRLIAAMLDYYELKIRVMELMLAEIEKEKLYKNEHYENERFY